MIAVLITVFIIGYLAIAAEHLIHINKAATALVTGVVCWVVYIFSQRIINHAKTPVLSLVRTSLN